MTTENKETTIKLAESNEPIENSNFCFNLAESPVPVLEFQANGNIYIYGRLAANDLEVVEAIREFFRKAKG